MPSIINVTSIFEEFGGESTGASPTPPTGLGVSPMRASPSREVLVTFHGQNTKWNTSAPTFTLSGVDGASLGTVTLDSDTPDTLATATLTLGAAKGTLTFTDSTTGDTATITVKRKQLFAFRRR